MNSASRLRLGAFLALVGGLGVGVAVLWTMRRPAEPPAEPSHVAPTPRAPDAAREAAVSPAPESTGAVRWLAAGGGDAPESNQVSIEQDLGLVSSTLGPGGVLLYASGPGSRAVQVLARERPAGGLVAELADLFAPRAGRDARYRETVLHPSGPATREAFLEALADATAQPGPPLLVYLAGHGVPRETPADNALMMWGRGELTPAGLADALDARPARETRVVITSCFSGGFGALAFRGADETGAPAAGRCGFFATTDDREAAGCDPDPDRRGQDGYGLHFLHALRGQAADTSPLVPAQVDFDGDGQVSLLEAHSRVRIVSRAVDVPTTTSERWLRRAAPAGGPQEAVSLPEEDAVIAALTRDLVLPPELARAQAQVAELDRALERWRPRPPRPPRRSSAGSTRSRRRSWGAGPCSTTRGTPTSRPRWPPRAPTSRWRCVPTRATGPTWRPRMTWTSSPRTSAASRSSRPRSCGWPGPWRIGSWRPGCEPRAARRGASTSGYWSVSAPCRTCPPLADRTARHKTRPPRGDDWRAAAVAAGTWPE
jgi:hypothetical protein